MRKNNNFFEKEVNPISAAIDLTDKEAEHIRRKLGFDEMERRKTAFETNIHLSARLLTEQTGRKPVHAFIVRISNEKGTRMKVYSNEKATCENIKYLIEQL